jgi:hypothetical protein
MMENPPNSHAFHTHETKEISATTLLVLGHRKSIDHIVREQMGALATGGSTRNISSACFGPHPEQAGANESVVLRKLSRLCGEIDTFENVPQNA